MQTIHFLTAKHSRELLGRISEQWGGDHTYLLDDYALAQTNEGKVYRISRDVEKMSLEHKKLNTVGMYLADVDEHNVRLSIEGAQLVGKNADKNILELDEAHARQWLAGMEVETRTELQGFVIVKFKQDIIGCGRVGKGTLYNFVPKNRRVKELLL